MKLKKKIAAVAKQQGLSVLQIERELGFSRGYIDKWDKNIPSVSKVAEVASLLNVSMDYLCFDTDTSERFSLSPNERELIGLYNQLNDSGQKMALDTVKALVASNIYNLAGQRDSLSREVV